MSRIPEWPMEDVLIWFDEPRSMTEVQKTSGYNRSTIWAHMKRSRSLGFIHFVGTKPGEYRGPRQKLYQLTQAGVDYLVVNDEV